MIVLASCGWLSMKGWLGWSRNRFVQWRWSMSEIIRDSNISAKPAKTPYHSFLGVPVIDRGVLQGVLVVQTMEPRVFPGK